MRARFLKVRFQQAAAWGHQSLLWMKLLQSTSTVLTMCLLLSFQVEWPYIFNIIPNDLPGCSSWHITHLVVKIRVPEFAVHEASGLCTAVAGDESWVLRGTEKLERVQSAWRILSWLDYRSLWYYWIWEYSRRPVFPHISSSGVEHKTSCESVRRVRFSKGVLHVNKQFWFSWASPFNSYNTIYHLHIIIYFNIESSQKVLLLMGSTL